MYALIDCNSFFCSVEKAFHPGLKGRPVCVLSNNDGCIVALTPEAKALGLRRGDPIFRVRDVVRRNRVHVFSSNITLYAAVSKRIVSILRKSIAQVENYSIDESFCDLSGYERYGLVDFMREIVEKIRLYTDIPTSVGIAPTKTLAKVAAKYAKIYKGYRSVCLIDTEEKRRKALRGIALGGIWGIGRNTLAALNSLNIRTPLEFADLPQRYVSRLFPLPALRTWKELNGQPCIDTREIIRNKSICTSRSFGKMVTDVENVKESVAHFAASCTEKLRTQQSLAAQVSVFLSSNRFRDDLPQYSAAASHVFGVPTADTLEITQAALELAEEIWRPNVYYKKTGVILSGIQARTSAQLMLFDTVSNRFSRARLMKTMDVINQKYGARSVLLAAEGSARRPWHAKSGSKSPNYLTDIDELLTVNI